MPMKHNLATKVQQRFQAARFILSTARPDDITIVKVGKDVRFKISEEERARKKPREPTKKVETTAYFSTDHVSMITPSQGIVYKHTKILEHSYLINSYMNVQASLNFSSTRVKRSIHFVLLAFSCSPLLAIHRLVASRHC